MLKLTASGRRLLEFSSRSHSYVTNTPAWTGSSKALSEGGRALMTLPAKGRALVKRVPEPVQLEFRKFSSRGAHLCREIFAGVVVVGLIIIVFGYGRLSRGPISLPALVPPIEAAINGELSDLHVKIDDAVLQRSSDGPGVLFRLRNIRLIDDSGSIVAQSPLAAIGLSGAALLKGRIVPGSVDFIGPRVLLFYSPDQGLALSFSRPTNAESDAIMRGSFAGDDQSASGSNAPAVAKPNGSPQLAQPGRELNVARTIADVFKRARSGNSSYLTRFGVKDAVVVLDDNGMKTQLNVPDFTIDLEHRAQRSILLGQANLSSAKGNWQLDFKTEQRTRSHSLSVTAAIQNLVPSGLAGSVPGFAPLKALDMPVSGEASVELSNSGEFMAGDVKLRMQSGDITPPWDAEGIMQIDSGDLHIRYAKDKDVAEIAPLTLRWGKSRVTVNGEFRPSRDKAGAISSWRFHLAANDAVLAAEGFNIDPIHLDEWSADGSFAPGSGNVDLSHFIIRSGTSSITLAGSIADAPGSPEIHLTGNISPMPLSTLKQFWPKFLAPKTRQWIGENVSGGAVKGGKVAISLAPGELAAAEGGGEIPPGAVNIGIDLAGMNIGYIRPLPPIATGDAKLTLSGASFAVDIPQGKVTLPSSGQQILLHDGRFAIADLRPKAPKAEITFKADGATPAVLQFLDQQPLGYLRAIGFKPNSFGGTAEGSFILDMPMREDLSLKDVKFRGSAELDQATAKGAVGDMDVEDGTVQVSLDEQAVDAKGDIRINGVPAKLSWQRIFDAPDDQQPPVQISAVLDEAARDKLGMQVNHLVRGPLPITLSVTPSPAGAQALSVQADLTNAQLIFDDMGWTKPKGRRASAEFDVDHAADGSINLDNLKILGDDINIDGSMSLDPGQHLKSFYFSDFSFDLITHVEISGTVKDGNVLEVETHGPSYDGKQFFQSLFSAGQLAEDAPPEPDNALGIDMTAHVGTVVGFYDTTARDVQVTLKKRKGKLVALDVKAQLNGQSPVAVRLDTDGGARIVRAEANDAGAAFRLVGFYPSVDGGEAQLQVNLDSSDPGTTSGTLWARDFDILGDSVVRDVLSDPNSAAAFGQHKQEIDQARLSFNQLRAPFTVGNGKFRLKDAYMNGPMLGATMRGTVDFKSQTVDLGGTYVPLYGLNSALGAIPVLGKVFVGRQGEGVVGITFNIQGKLGNPDVFVNPMSVMTPGIFRQIFEFNGSTAESAATPPSDFGAPLAH